MGGKGLLLDLTTKIPYIIHDPRTSKDQRGRQLDQIVSSLDYTRTILDYAGIVAPAEMEGRSLRPLVEGKDTLWRDELFLESLFTMRDNPFQEGIRTQRWKYIRFYDGKMSFKEADVDFNGRTPEFEMLFDRQADPTEHHNLATDPQHAAILAELRQKTAAQSVAINLRRADYMKVNSIQPRTTGANKKAKK
jgi:arylsulfatase A-like enzyme